jgi:hypothetical protein
MPFCAVEISEHLMQRIVTGYVLKRNLHASFVIVALDCVADGYVLVSAWCVMGFVLNIYA